VSAADQWLGRLAMLLAIASRDLPGHLQQHTRDTLDEFLKSEAAHASLEPIIREEVKR
jgi:hypothetical protein